MNISINTKEFSKALSFVGKIIPSTGITPIFQCILMEAKSNGTLMVTGSDTNTVLSTVVRMSDFDLEGQESVKIAAPYTIIAKTLSTLPDTAITLAYTHDGEFNYSLTLEFESNFFGIPCEDPKTYLKMPEMGQAESIKIPAQALQRGIDQVVHCTSDDENLLPAFRGVNIDIDNGIAQFAGTNGHMIATYDVDLPDNSLSKKMLIPARFAQMVSDLIGDAEGDIELKVDTRRVRVVVGECAAYGTMIDERFPDYQNAMPTSYKYIAVVNSEELKTVVKRAAIFANQKTMTILLNFRDNMLFVKSENSDKNTKSNQDMRIESEIEDLVICFNKSLIDKALSTVSGDFRIHLNASSQGATIEPDAAENERVRYFIMPVMPPTSLHVMNASDVAQA